MRIYIKFKREFLRTANELGFEAEDKIHVDKIIPSILGGLHCNDFLLLDGNIDTLIYIENFKLQTSNFKL